ncbi:sigma-70 family RNA polymerase sigma factor [Undibacterium seohonense]|uniref:Sigma-70 family RNA polymerase sigma factor n=1 Tax=Undibacterium seohonense TaxID=1344950 RepID=A0ABR6X826_9BURK|nr:sigma-70 family RNA polymerase sigma factor [Undibacterium seohonense]MBC3808793.1 sigma-70 family RNA polymerase sigma factor [Undibacterium seohonense]
MAISLISYDQLSELRPQLLRFTKQRIYDDAIAEDVVQESLLAVLEAPERFAGKSSLATYVIGILKFKIIDNFRRAKQTQNLYAEPNFDTTCSIDASPHLADDRYGINRSSLCEEFDPVAALEQKKFFIQLEQALGLLPIKNARAFTLADCLEVDSTDICAELGMSKKHMMVALHRARHALRKAPSLRSYIPTTELH